jgi:hypothetical protein
MAEGLMHAHDSARVEVVTAALELHPPDALAVRVMAEAGIDIAQARAKALDEVGVYSFDLVVTLGNCDAGCRPDLPGMPPNHTGNCPRSPATGPTTSSSNSTAWCATSWGERSQHCSPPTYRTASPWRVAIWSSCSTT